MKELAGRVAGVTGVSNGIGATARDADGVAVAVNYSSVKEGAECVVSQIMR